MCADGDHWGEVSVVVRGGVLTGGSSVSHSLFVSRCSLLTFERSSFASMLSFSVYCSKVTNLSLHRSLSIIKKLNRCDSLPIFISRSSRASTNALARLRRHKG